MHGNGVNLNYQMAMQYAQGVHSMRPAAHGTPSISNQQLQQQIDHQMQQVQQQMLQLQRAQQAQQMPHGQLAMEEEEVTAREGK